MEHGFIHDVTICVAAAWLLGVLAQFCKQPLILAYLLAGFLIGPHALGLIHNHDSIQTISRLGLILLLFMIGLELDLKKVAAAGKEIVSVTSLQVLGGIALGIPLFMLLGFPMGQGRLDALYLSVAMAFSSTLIIVKLLYDKRELDTLAGRLTLGVMVLQDLFTILFLAMQPNLNDIRPGVVGLSLAKVGIVGGVAFALSKYVLPHLFRKVARLPELVVIGGIAWCFLMAAFAESMDLSGEMGALIAGAAISTFPYTLDIVAKVASLRDFFITLFFVALGMGIAIPKPIELVYAVAALVFLNLSRIVTVFPLLHWMRHGNRAAFIPALNLSQVSELSLVILAIGAKLGHVGEQATNVVAYTFVLGAVASTYSILNSEAVLRSIQPLLVKIGFKDIGEPPKADKGEKPAPTIFMLGFAWTASSLLEEMERHHPRMVRQLRVIDFNPHVNQELRARGVDVVYGDITAKDVLHHAGIEHARIILCTISDSLLKGATNRKLLQLVRELNPHAQVIMHAQLLSEAPLLIAAGASHVSAPRLLEARELLQVLVAARDNLLPELRAELERDLASRREVVP